MDDDSSHQCNQSLSTIYYWSGFDAAAGLMLVQAAVEQDVHKIQKQTEFASKEKISTIGRTTSISNSITFLTG